MKIKKLNTLVALFIGIVLMAPQCLAAAFGVSPPRIENNYLKRGSNYVYVVNLSASVATGDMKVTPTLLGDPELANWVKIREGGNLIMRKGQTILPMALEISIPQDAALGRYEGSISLSASSLGDANGNSDAVSILLGGNVSLRFNVIDYDVSDFWVKSIEVSPIRLGEPLILDLTVKNLGNTTIEKIETTTTISNVNTGEKVATVSESSISEPVYAQTMKTVTQMIPVGMLKEGERYQFEVVVVKEGKIAYSNKVNIKIGSGQGVIKTSVNVVDEDQLRSAASDKGVKLTTTVTVIAPITNQLIIIVIGLLLVIIGISAKIYLNMKRKK